MAQYFSHPCVSRPTAALRDRLDDLQTIWDKDTYARMQIAVHSTSTPEQDDLRTRDTPPVSTYVASATHRDVRYWHSVRVNVWSAVRPHS